MSGFYLLALIAIWLFAGRMIYRVWRYWKPADLMWKILHIIIGAVLFSLWFGGAFWEVAGKKMYWDAQVREMCAKDGGVKVYETVTLPVDRFDKYGVIYIPSKQRLKSGDEYYYEQDIHFYKQEHPTILIIHFRVLRTIDNKLLGVATHYSRIGGDLPGPWHDSSFGCPEHSDLSDLKKEIFSK